MAALGLAITFGLMGVINMAHGEMLMLGAYATYVMQRLFQGYAPEAFEWYLLAAIPTAFVTCAAIGVLLERSVIRFLYGRPLETLLATWGISLLLIQSVRLFFGAQNVEVANPAWLSGGVEVLYGVVLPYSRLAIIAFVVLVVALMWLLLQRTNLGLHVRAVTQNRPMASCMGIATSRVDMWTFGLGSGLAGLGGVALSQIGNVGPELGQSYIIDSFMVVVLGGVGNIAGTVLGGLGLGLINKFLEPVAGAVLGKIGVLIFIVLFIQRRPQGLFASQRADGGGLGGEFIGQRRFRQSASRAGSNRGLRRRRRSPPRKRCSFILTREWLVVGVLALMALVVIPALNRFPTSDSRLPSA